MTMRAGDEGEDLPCHRAVLARSSEVFDRMLSSQMKAGGLHVPGLGFRVVRAKRSL